MKGAAVVGVVAEVDFEIETETETDLHHHILKPSSAALSSYYPVLVGVDCFFVARSCRGYGLRGYCDVGVVADDGVKNGDDQLRR